MKRIVSVIFTIILLCFSGLSGLQLQAQENSSVADASAKNVRPGQNTGASILGIASTSRAVAMDIRNQREVKIGLSNASVTPFGVATGGRPFYAGDFSGNGTWYVISNPDTLYTVDTTTGVFTSVGQISGIPVGSNTSGLTWDYSSNRFYLCNLSGGIATLYTLDLTVRVASPVGPIVAGTVIDIAASNTGQIFGIKFGSAAGIPDSLIGIDKTTGAGTIVGSLGVDINFAHGLDFDPATDSLFYPGYIGAGVNNLYRINTQTGLATLVGPLAAGEYDCFSVIGSPATPVNDTLLVLLQDTTTASAKRHADHDTLFAHLSSLVSAYRVVYGDTSWSTLPNLSTYGKIFYVETSFDAARTRNLGLTARTAIKAWLTSGTPTDRKRLTMIGGDLGYNYDRTGGAGNDTTFSRNFLKLIYRVDNGSATQSTIVGVGINPGGSLTLNSSPVGGGFYPDGCTPVAGSIVLYQYGGRPSTDTVSSIANVAPGFTTACLFADPRYFTGAAPNGGFRKALRDMLAFTGTITSVNPGSEQAIPDRYILSQNYPNPFNPTTTIQFSLPSASMVTLEVYNILGQQVASLADGIRGAGVSTVVWNGQTSAGLPAATGMYFYRFVARSLDGKNVVSSSKKMMLIK